MALISLRDISLGFGGPLLLENINLQIEAGERVGLLGRNGAGKSTLLRLLNDDFLPHSGDVARQQGIRTAFLPQEVPQAWTGDVGSIVAGGLEHSISTLRDGHEWQRQLHVKQMLSRMQLDASNVFELLSAGMKRRVILARGLASNPDLLLLDEPTNHLDIEAIDWLEGFLKRWGGTLLFVTHDRLFLQHLATRIIELDGGRIIDWKTDYATFIQRRDAVLEAEAQRNALFDRKLAQEEQWIRKGIEARRTRNEGRVRALKRLREERRQRREQPGSVRMQIQSDQRSGRLVIEAENVSFAYGDKPMVKDFSTVVQRGDKLAIVGPNGSGKTTLLRLLMGELAPQQGEIRLGTNLQMAYFDQLRLQLDENKSVLDNVGQGRDTISINGRTRNLMGYLEDFLFTRERARAPISALSGGERNRLLLARLLAQPANLLVLDEPTNDLDLETLEVLEDLLLEFDGTLLLVSHDRAFLNNLATSTLVLDGSGNVQEYVGGYDDWQAQQKVSEEALPETVRPAAVPEPEPASSSRKLSYKEQRALEARQRELAELPAKIEKLEAEQARLAAEMAAPSFYQRDDSEILADVQMMKQLEDDLAAAYKRWEELEGS